jgi:hypothetical protein
VSAARARPPVCNVVDAEGVVVGCGLGLEDAQGDALERAVRLREARLGRPLREAERDELEAWAAGLGPLAAPVRQPDMQPQNPDTRGHQPGHAQPDIAAMCPDCPLTNADNRQVVLFPGVSGQAAPARVTAARSRPRRSGLARGQVVLFPALGPPPLVCPGCGGAVERHGGLGRPRRWCASCRPARPRDPRQRPAAGDRAVWSGVEVEVVGRERVRPAEGGPRRQVAVLVRLPSGREEIIPLRTWREGAAWSEPS